MLGLSPWEIHPRILLANVGEPSGKETHGIQSLLVFCGSETLQVAVEDSGLL